jgi:phosphatidate cytidylyltransferase
MKKKVLQINEISSSTKKSFLVRTITSLILAAILVPSVMLGDWYFVVPVVLISFVSFYEYINVLSTKKYPFFIDIFTFVMAIFLTYWVWFKSGMTNGFISESGHIIISDISISTLLLATTMLGLFMFALMYTRFDVTDVGYLSTMTLLVSLGFQSFFFLRFSPMSSIAGNYTYDGNCLLSGLLLFYVAIGSFMSDIGAYATGILFGKHKMNPRISPKKTWEGFVGGVVLSFVCSFTFAMVLDLNGIPLLNTILDMEHWYFVLFISIAMPFISVLGDLLFSALKRYYNRKDFSNVLPGHGGVLDRIDSLLVTSLVVTVLILAFSFYRGLFI